MTLLTSSWRCSVAATALWALLGSSPNAALADDKPAEKANAEKASAEKARSVTPEREQLYNQLRSIRQKAEQLEKEGKHDQAERLKGEAKELMAKLHALAGQPGPGGKSTSNPERERLYNQLRSMRQKVEQLEKDGKHDEAERLKGETKELMAKLQASAGRSGPGGMSASNPDRERLYNQLRSIRQKVEQLEKDGKHEEAERLKGEAKELMAKLQASAGRSGAGGMSSSNPEQEKMRQKLMAIGQRVEQLEKEGKHDEAERVKSEAKGIMARLNPHAQPSPGDMGARMQHLRTAAENLMAAGCEPEARHVMEMIQQMESQMREGGRPMLAPGAAAPEQANARMVQELRGQVEQLSRQMQEMREQLNRSKEHGDRK